MTENSIGLFETDHLDCEFDLHDEITDLWFSDPHVGFTINLLAAADGIVTDRHDASTGTRSITR